MYAVPTTGKNIEIENMSQITRGCGRGGCDELPLFNVYRFYVKDEKSLKICSTVIKQVLEVVISMIATKMLV